MKKLHSLLLVLFLAVGSLSAQAEFSLDDAASTPAPPPARTRAPTATPAAGGVKINLYADTDFLATVPAVVGEGATPTVVPAATFLQNHTGLLLKALYNGDQASMLVDAFHPDSYFELGINGSLFGPEFLRIPVLGTSSFRFGRLLVPFGDFEFHHLYGGYVEEKGLLFNKLWSDLGVSWKLSLTDSLDAETFVGNGLGDAGGFPSSQPQPGADNNTAKAFGERLRWAPTPATYVMASWYFDQWGADTNPGQVLFLAGLDAGTKLGPVGLKAGGFFQQNSGVVAGDYWRYAWYGETKFTLDKNWALRLRGGSMNPDSRVMDDTDQINLNAALVWDSGPIIVEVMYSLNQETYRLFDPLAPNNTHQLLIKCLLNM